MDEWTLIRLLHLLALVLFVGGQLALAAVVVPVMRRRADDGSMRAMARRFGIASVAALAVLVVTGAAMAGHFERWEDGTLHAKLAVLGLLLVLIGLHARYAKSRLLAAATLASSLAIVWLGVALAH